MSDNKEFGASMDKAELKILSQLAENMGLACLVIERDAKINCPVDQGITRASIHSDVKFTLDSIEGIIGVNLESAPYVHQGTGIYAINGDGRKTPWYYVVEKGKYKGGHFTRGQKPQPFLEDAKIKNKDRIPYILAGR